MREVRPQVIHAHLHEGALIGAVLSRLWRVPLVFDFQGSMTSEMVDHDFLKPGIATFTACCDRLESKDRPPGAAHPHQLGARLGPAGGGVWL